MTEAGFYSAEEAVGSAIFDLLAEQGQMSGLFSVELNDDGTFQVDMIIPLPPEILGAL